MKICDCYRAEENWLHEIGVCFGTKERDPCSCGGDESKCDFYPEKRKKAEKATACSTANYYYGSCPEKLPCGVCRLTMLACPLGYNLYEVTTGTGVPQ